MANVVTSRGKVSAVFPGSSMGYIENFTVELADINTEFAIAAGRSGYHCALLQLSYVEATAATIEWRALQNGFVWAVASSTLLTRWELTTNQAPNYRLGQPILWTPKSVEPAVGWDLGITSSAALTLLNLTVGYFKNHQVWGG